MAVKIQINEQSLEVDEALTLFDCADRAGIKVPSSCNRKGICGECLVQVTEGVELLSEPTDPEKHLTEGFRLSCQCSLNGQSGELRCHTLRRGNMRIVRGVDKAHVVEHKLDPAVTRDGGNIMLDGDVVDTSTGPIHGLAIDIGTTTVVMNLVNLESGEIVATTAFENPQMFGGSDIMSRICYDRDRGQNLLQRALHAYLAHAINDLPCDPQTIYEMVIVGNTTMRDLFFGLDVWSIGQKPYRSIVENAYREGKRASTTMTSLAEMMGIPIHPLAKISSLPLVSGHVGADAAAVLLAVGMAQQDKTVVVMDIGTNTELFVGHKGKLFAASCPAGPAFEGGGITFGMPALPGAIERVQLDHNGGITLQTIQRKAPIGICGSGLVDLLGEMRRTGKMILTGRFAPGVPQPFVLDQKSRVSFQESDVSRLAQAKAANVAALKIVMNAYGVGFDEIDKLYLAGGFARHLNLAAARGIGLIPNLPDEKIVQIGNAAIEGATMALKSASLREQLEELVKTITHVELEEDPEFFEYFVQGCMLEPFE